MSLKGTAIRRALSSDRVVLLVVNEKNVSVRIQGTAETKVNSVKKKKKNDEKRRSRLGTFILVVVFLLGLAILFYPNFSNYWNSTRQTKVLANYSETVNALTQAEHDRIWQEAVAYNMELAARPTVFNLGPEQKARYDSMLKPGTTGVLGEIEIPSIDVILPIYHGTEESVLQMAAGHLDWTSLPTGGPSTHCVLSGHRGLPTARLFTDIDKLIEGDYFMLRILDEVLTYEVDQILIVEPQDVQPLEIVPGEDLCTLVTCTPYGINTHRLLVRGHRIPNLDTADAMRITSEAVQIEELIVAPIVAIPIILFLLLLLMIQSIIVKKLNDRKGDVHYETLEDKIKDVTAGLDARGVSDDGHSRRRWPHRHRKD